MGCTRAHTHAHTRAHTYTHVHTCTHSSFIGNGKEEGEPLPTPGSGKRSWPCSGYNVATATAGQTLTPGLPWVNRGKHGSGRQALCPRLPWEKHTGRGPPATPGSGRPRAPVCSLAWTPGACPAGAQGTCARTPLLSPEPRPRRAPRVGQRGPLVARASFAALCTRARLPRSLPLTSAHACRGRLLPAGPSSPQHPRVPIPSRCPLGQRWVVDSDGPSCRKIKRVWGQLCNGGQATGREAWGSAPPTTSTDTEAPGGEGGARGPPRRRA